MSATMAGVSDVAEAVVNTIAAAKATATRVVFFKFIPREVLFECYERGSTFRTKVANYPS